MEGWELFNHIIAREIKHFGWAPWAFTTTYMLFHYLGVWKSKLDLPGIWRYLVPLVVVWFAISVREAADVAHGGWVGKSYIDIIWWGVVLSTWAWLQRWIQRHT